MKLEMKMEMEMKLNCQQNLYINDEEYLIISFSKFL